MSTMLTLISFTTVIYDISINLHTIITIDQTLFDGGARKMQFNTKGPTIDGNLVVLKVVLQLRHQGLVGT